MSSRLGWEELGKNISQVLQRLMCLKSSTCRMNHLVIIRQNRGDASTFNAEWTLDSTYLGSEIVMRNLQPWGRWTVSLIHYLGRSIDLVHRYLFVKIVYIGIRLAEDRPPFVWPIQRWVKQREDFCGSLLNFLNLIRYKFLIKVRRYRFWSLEVTLKWIKGHQFPLSCPVPILYPWNLIYFYFGSAFLLQKLSSLDFYFRFFVYACHVL